MRKLRGENIGVSGRRWPLEQKPLKARGCGDFCAAAVPAPLGIGQPRSRTPQLSEQPQQTSSAFPVPRRRATALFLPHHRTIRDWVYNRKWMCFVHSGYLLNTYYTPGTILGKKPDT